MDASRAVFSSYLLTFFLSFYSTVATASERTAEQVVMEMFSAWNAVDLDRVIELFATDGVLHSVMTDPVVGRHHLRSHLAPLFAGIEKLELKVQRIVVNGNTVFVERVDEFVFRGKKGSVPVVGVFEIRAGTVVEWREYYDRAQLYAEMGIPVPPAGAPAATH